MKISEMVSGLERLKKLHGDINVQTFDPEELSVHGYMTPVECRLGEMNDAEGKISYVFVCDEETAGV